MPAASASTVIRSTDGLVESVGSCLVFNAAVSRILRRSWWQCSRCLRSMSTIRGPCGVTRSYVRQITIDSQQGLRYVRLRFGYRSDHDDGHPASDSRTERAVASPPRSGDRASVRRPRAFFLALDKVQVKYEMLRTHVIDGLSATAAAEQHGYSRAAFYLITAAFDEAGMRGLLDEPRGRRGPLKLTPEVIEFVASADPTLSGAQLALEVEARFGVSLHRRTVERARR